MFKSFSYYILTFGLLLLIGYYAHNGVLAALGKTLSYPLLDVYIFHAIFSFGICTVLLLLSQLPGLAPQLGFLYLAGFLLKFFIFAAVFQNIVLRESPLTRIESFSLLVPIVIFLSLEVYFVAKLLRMIDAKQK